MRRCELWLGCRWGRWRGHGVQHLLNHPGATRRIGADAQPVVTFGKILLNHRNRNVDGRQLGVAVERLASNYGALFVKKLDSTEAQRRVFEGEEGVPSVREMRRPRCLCTAAQLCPQKQIELPAVYLRRAAAGQRRNDPNGKNSDAASAQATVCRGSRVRGVFLPGGTRSRYAFLRVCVTTELRRVHRHLMEQPSAGR